MRFAFPGVTALTSLASALAAVVVLVVPAAAQTTGWQSGPGAVLDNTYSGVVDRPANGAGVAAGASFQVSGWFVDTTAQGWAGADDVQVWLGTMGGGGRMLAKAFFAQPRPDVASATGNPYWAASGFSAIVSGLPGGNQTINVYAHTAAKGWWYRGVTVNSGGSTGSTPSTPAPSTGGTGAPVLTVTNPPENANVSTKNDYTIEGTVNDQSAQIEIWINGERNSQGGQSLGTTTPQAGGGWSLTFKPTRFASTHTNIYVYARNPSGQETLVTRGFNIVDR